MDLKSLSLRVCLILILLGSQPSLGDTPAPTPNPSNIPVQPKHFDPCGGPLELLNKVGNATPCVFLIGEAALTANYGSANLPVNTKVNITDVGSAGISTYAHAFGYPASTAYIGVSPSSDITFTPPSFVQVNSGRFGTLAAGASDMKFGYKQLLYFDPKKGTMFGIALTYKAPSGSQAFRGPGPAYSMFPILTQPFTETIGVSLVLPVNNTTLSTPSGTRRGWSWTPQLIPYWESPGGTLIGVAIQHNFNPSVTPVVLDVAQLLSRHISLTASYGGSITP